MRNGELITHPSDERQFKGLLETLFYRLTDKPTGGAAPVSKLPHEMDYTGYVNQETGDGKIFSRELISQMRGDEYTSSEPAIMAQLRSIGIPYESDLELASISGGGVVYVKPYTRADGTEVRGYYRSV